MERRPRSPPSLPQVIDLATVRERLRIPTLLAAYLARRIGTTARITHPGLVEAHLPEDGLVIQIRVKALDIEAMEAEALRAAEEPLPPEITLVVRR